MKFNVIFLFIVNMVCVLFVSGCGDSKYSGKYYCDKNSYFDINMGKKTISTYIGFSKSSMPDSVSDIKILADNKDGIMFEIVKTGAQLRIENDKLYVPGFFSSTICYRNLDEAIKMNSKKKLR